MTTVLPVATERTSSESSFTRGLKEVLLSPLPPPPPPSQRDGYLSCSRSSGPLWRRTRQSDSSSAWISDERIQRHVIKKVWNQTDETVCINTECIHTDVLTYLLIFVDFPRERTFVDHSLSGEVQTLWERRVKQHIRVRKEEKLLLDMAGSLRYNMNNVNNEGTRKKQKQVNQHELLDYLE